jgi:hypothetical protein
VTFAPLSPLFADEADCDEDVSAIGDYGHRKLLECGWAGSFARHERSPFRKVVGQAARTGRGPRSNPAFPDELVAVFDFDDAAVQIRYAIGDVEPIFDHLAIEWEKATAFDSIERNMVTHPAYQAIIGLGPSAVPLILARLEQNLRVHR